MRLEELKEGMQTYSDREQWAIAVQEAGATELLDEMGDEQYPTDIHLYAVGGLKLWGTWNVKTNEGTVYGGKGLTFDKRKRQFKKVPF